ncbi:DUF3426 domain-containing protein [Ramlibacter sp. MAHUQ-53]|uniref:DUF3426 domain-containing protein n=1 Tax=unclassified Ramlibacter TaxID=2617605 RepID=UPI003636433B
MSLITRCPACGTRFRVVPDQLKISDGWVRCGQCSEVFDASAVVQSVPDLAPASLPSSVAADASRFAPSPAHAAPPSEPRDTAADAGFEATVAVEDLPAPEAQDTVVELPPWASEPSADAPGGPAEPHEPHPSAEGRIEPTLDAPAGPELPSPGAASASLQPEETRPAAAAGTPDDAPGPASEAAGPSRLEDISFVRQARRRALWRRPVVRAALGLLALALLAVLSAQLALHHRDRLANAFPVLKPALELLCQPPQCRIGPPRQIDAVAIDGSSFSRLRPDAYRLTVTLSNPSSAAVALPALELTLTDTQDQPVLRRVLQPADLGPEAPAVLAASTEWTATLTLAVAPGPATARIAGYRLLAFYP